MTFLFFLITLFLNLSFHGSDGANKLHKQQTFQLNKEYDCVDIYKQPAFDNILLKNHKIQMKPSFLPKGLKIKTNSSFGVQSKGCPEGMVPIRRTKVDGDYENIHPLSSTAPGRHFAAFNIKGGKATYGVRAAISLHNPPVRMNQVSMAQVRIESGPPDELNFIQVGWAVHPRLYGDSHTHFTTYWTADNSRNTGCYNLVCPGFVQVHPHYVVGARYSKVSVPGGKTWVIQPLIYLDHKSGNWWLFMDSDKEVGYFPKELFAHLRGGANDVQYGGWTFNSPDGLSPPMGSGEFPPRKRFHNPGSFTQMQVVNKYNKLIDIHGYSLRKIADNTSCYDIKYWGNLYGVYAKCFNYGGPGGMCGI